MRGPPETAARLAHRSRTSGATSTLRTGSLSTPAAASAGAARSIASRTAWSLLSATGSSRPSKPTLRFFSPRCRGLPRCLRARRRSTHFRRARCCSPCESTSPSADGGVRHLHVCGFHVAKNNPNFQIVTEHYGSRDSSASAVAVAGLRHGGCKRAGHVPQRRGWRGFRSSALPGDQGSRCPCEVTRTGWAGGGAVDWFTSR